MPIEIRELTIKAVVRDGDAGETTEAFLLFEPLAHEADAPLPPVGTEALILLLDDGF